jgi:hypothetical protein
VRRALGALAVALLASVAPARADHPGGGTSVVVAGLALTCTASTGVPVWWMVTPTGGGPVGLNPSRGGVSWTGGAFPHLFIRGDVFGNLPPQVQLYIAVHECGHFHLPPRLNTEIEVDCWTVKTLLANRWLTESDLDYVRKQLLAGGVHVGSWGHPGSLVHAENIPKCLTR